MAPEEERGKLSLQERSIWITVPMILVLLPFSLPIQYDDIAGAGPDVISTIWAMWWFQQEWSGAAWGGASQLFNFPFGGSGAILSPISATIWAVLDPWLGVARATTFTALITIWLMMLSIVAVGRRLGFSRLSCSTMSLLFLLPRYPIFTLGETGVVGVAVLPILWGLCCLISIFKEEAKPWHYLGLTLCIPLQGLENPYLVFVLPLFVGSAILVASRRRQLLISFGVGLLLMGLVGLLLKGSSGSYESVRPSGATKLGPLHFWAVEREWARASWGSFFHSQKVIWPSGSMDSIHIQGREFLGFSALVGGIIALLTQFRNTIHWFALGVMGVLLTTGSDWGGFPSLFGLMNSVALTVVRALTQPTRYFLLYSIGFGVCVGFASRWLLRKHVILAIVLWSSVLLEALWVGGLSLRVPRTVLPQSDCLDEMQWDGPVLVWPWDGADDLWLESTLKSRVFQMVHSQAGATIGTGSWSLVGMKFPGHRLRELGWRKAMEGKGSVDTAQLSAWGYRYAIVDKTTGRLLERRAREEVFGEHNRIRSCDTIDIYQLPSDN